MNKLSILLAVLFVSLLGCRTPEGNYDPVKTEVIKAAFTPPVTSAIRRGIFKNPEAREYVEQLAVVLEKMRDSKSFDPLFLEQVLAPLSAGLPNDKEWVPAVLEVKDTLVALYKVLWQKRTTVDLDEEAWGYHVTDYFANVLRTALNDTL